MMLWVPGVREAFCAGRQVAGNSLKLGFSSSSFSFKGLFYYVYSVLPACIPGGQKRAPDLIWDGCESPCSCWGLNSGPLAGQPTQLLTAEPILQIPIFGFGIRFLCVALAILELTL